MRELARRLGALSGWRRLAAAAGLGALAVLALPPIYAVPVLLVSFTGLVWLIDGSASRRAAFAAGWWFGFAHFVAGLYWFAYALLTDPERFAWLIPPAVLGISAALAVFPALAALAARLCAPGVARVAGLAAAWVALEWARGRVFTGFPWNLTGTAWTISEPMIQFAALAGTYGLSLVTVLVAAMPA
ncbi:MAG: apolipoprotein N-acyltransferase, partial [Alphaproteobacteria bacterium]|nr:apolipoprotein N-acyltransferase [Alphaproteobacteria bacterium]